MKRGKTVALPRPANKPRWNRTSLTITMHPSELDALQRRAKAASMSLTAYVAALLSSDEEDVPGVVRKFSVWDALTRGPQEPLLVSGRNRAVEQKVASEHAAGRMLPPHEKRCACATCMARDLNSPLRDVHGARSEQPHGAER